MTTPDFFAWRAPLSPDWGMRWQSADAMVRSIAAADPKAVADLGLQLRRLASERLGPSEQLKLEALARRLMAANIPLEPLRRLRIGLIGNRTLSFLSSPLRAAGLARGLLIEPVEAPYDAVMAYSMGRDCGFGEGLDVIALVLDEDAFTQGPLLDAAAEDAAVAAGRETLMRIAQRAREAGAMPVIATVPVPSSLASSDLAIAGTAVRLTSRMNAVIADGAAQRLWTLWDLDGLATQVGPTWQDARLFHDTKSRFSLASAPLIADHLSRIGAAMAGKSARVAVVDLDNTLWGGVVGDDGVAGLTLGPGSAVGEAHAAFQTFLLDLRRRGIVLAVCSKNDDAVAREAFRQHPGMLLKESDIAVFQANWSDKATNLRAIAETLQLGLDALVFLDDNPAERLRVRQELPQVHVPEIGSDPSSFPLLVRASGVFEHLLLTRDDLGRVQSYESNARRAELRATAANYDDYLASLGMTLTIRGFSAADRPRIAQLISKSNQFNLTTRRHGEQDLARFEAAPGEYLCWQASLRDIFGDHGTIAIVIVRKGEDAWTIDTWLQSCRILARGVEETLMNELVAAAAQATELRGAYVATARNAMVADFFPRMGFASAGEGQYRVSPTAFRPLPSFMAVVRE